MKESKQVINKITLEKFAFPVIGTYELETSSGIITIVITDKKSHFMPGDCTVYSGTYNGITITDKVIGYWKKQFGAVINHRSDSAINSAKVLTDSEITDKVGAYKGKVETALSNLNKVISDFGAPVTLEIDSIVSAFRASVLERNELAKIEKEKAESAKLEREKKAERNELAKNVRNVSELQAELIKAVLAGDTAKIAELSAKIA